MVGDRGVTPLHERQGELAALAMAVDGATAGRGAVVLVEGPPGIGKTRLLGATADLARDAGLAVLDARGAEFERAEPYAIVRQLLERELLTAPPERRTALLAGVAEHAERVFSPRPDAQADAWAVLHGLYWLVANLAGERPLVLAVDDLHWTDAASARFLAYLARRSADLPLVLVCGLRPREVQDHVLDELGNLPHTSILQPDPLSHEAIAKILAAGFGAEVDDAFVGACRDATGGNPFLLGELSVALRTDGIAPTAAMAAQVGELRPATTRRSLALRLAGLPTDARDLAGAVAVLGDNARLRLAADVAGMDEDSAATAVAALIRTEILVDDLPLSFRHPLLRAAIHADLDPARRAGMHARAVDVLSAIDERPERIARHLLAVEPLGDHGRWELLVAAGRSAMDRGAPDAALPFLERALQEPPPAQERATTIALLGRVAAQVGATGPARTWLRDAIALTPLGAGRAELWLALTRTTMLDVSMAAGVAVAQEALADLEGVDDLLVERLRTEMLCQAATHPETAALAADLVPGLPAPPGDSPAERLELLRLLLGEGRGLGTAERTVELVTRAIGENAVIVEDETSESLVLPQLLQHLIFSDACEQALQLCDALDADARGRGATWGIISTSACRAWVRLREGDVAAAEADARRALALPVLPMLAQPFTTAALMAALTWGGHLDEAEDVARASGCGPQTPELVHAAMLFMTRGWLRRAQRRHPDALEDFLEYGRRVTDVGWDEPAFGWRAEVAEQLVLLAHPTEALELAEEQLRLGRRWGAPTAIAAGLRATGLALGAKGLDALAESVATLDGSPVRVERVRSLIALGAAQRRHRERRAAADTLAEALDLADRCSAGWFAGQAENELRALGLRPRTRRRSGPDALTASERRVCELAAAGMSNREIAQELFVTAKTVENHLGRAYHKLGVASREELTGVLSTVPA